MVHPGEATDFLFPAINRELSFGLHSRQ
jgi:hypothetical protein